MRVPKLTIGRAATPFLLLISTLFVSCVDESKIDSPNDGIRIVDGVENIAIKKIVEDQSGFLYMISDYGMFRFDGTNYLHYTSTADPNSISVNTINDIHIDNNGDIWLATQKGVDCLKQGGTTFEHYLIDDYNNYTMRILEDNQGRLLTLTRTGIFLLNKERAAFDKVISFENGVDFSISSKVFIDNLGQVWIHSENALERYDNLFNYQGKYELNGTVGASIYDGASSLYLVYPDRIRRFDLSSMQLTDNVGRLEQIVPRQIIHISALGSNQMIIITRDDHYCYNFITNALYSHTDNNLPYWIPLERFVINSVTKSNNGTVYFATNNGFRSARAAEQVDATERSMIRFMQQDKSDKLVSNGRFVWKVLGRQMKILDIKTHTERTIDINEVLGLYAPSTNASFSPILAPDGRLFFSSGQYIYACTVNEAGIPAFECRYVCNSNSPIRNIAIDGEGTVWLGGTELTLYYGLRPQNGEKSIEMQTINIESEFRQIHSSRVTTLRNGNVVFGFTDIGLVIVNSRTMQPHNIPLSETEKQMYISTIEEDNEGYIWVGTTDVGLFILNPSTGESVKVEQFADMRIHNVVCDRNGTVYILNDDAIYRYLSGTNSFEQISMSESGVGNNTQLFAMPDGRAAYSYLDHIALLDKTRTTPIDVNLGAIVTSHNRLISIGVTPSEEKVKILLNKKPEDMTIYLSVIGENNASLAQYIYDIPGLTEGWTTLVNRGGIPLYGLHYGKNDIHLQAVSPYGSFDSDTLDMEIRILRPWYTSMTVMILAILVVIAMCILIVKLIANNRIASTTAEIERREREMLERVNMHNMDFFANISHEFRTPLTIISGTASTLCNETPQHSQNARLLAIMRRNADRMLKLVSQLMDFNHLEHDTLRLSVQTADVAKQISEIVENFSASALQKHIDLTVNGAEHPQLMWVDQDKLEKVMYNLLSNALKFTPSGGEVSVNISRIGKAEAGELFGKPAADLGDDNYLCVKVQDTGIGIPNDRLTAIFDRFESSGVQGGSGIGLYLTRSLIELHHGFIKAENNVAEESTNGAQFVFILPMSSRSYSEQERTPLESPQSSIDEKSTMSEYVATMPENSTLPESAPKVLVIDDDYEIVYYLQSILAPHYNVIVAFDANNGYKLIEQEMPDLVISDMVMLEVDGTKLCKMVRENIAICHIPIILLTAKSTMEDKIAGLDAGADAYIVKPFEPQLLMAQMRSLLESRNRNQQAVNLSTETSTINMGALVGKDKILMDKIYEVMESSLSDADLNVTQISAMLGISRTKFYYKIKALTGKTPNEFFKTYKLNRSVEFIREGKYKMSVIADMVGFSSPSHFANSFKKQFGVLPSKYFDHKR